MTACSYFIYVISSFISVWILILFLNYLFFFLLSPLGLLCWVWSIFFWSMFFFLKYLLTVFFRFTFKFEIFFFASLWSVFLATKAYLQWLWGKNGISHQERYISRFSEGHGNFTVLLSPLFKSFSFLSGLIIHTYCYSLIAKSSAVWFLTGIGEVTYMATSHIMPQLIILTIAPIAPTTFHICLPQLYIASEPPLSFMSALLHIFMTMVSLVNPILFVFIFQGVLIILGTAEGHFVFEKYYGFSFLSFLEIWSRKRRQVHVFMPPSSASPRQ